MKDNISHSLFVPQQPDEVWEYLTRPDLMELWLMKNDFEPVVGRQFRFMTNPIPKFDFDGITYCTVLEVDPCKKLSYSWKSGPGDGLITVDSLVTWTLTPKDGGTELLLEHTGFKEARHFAIFSALDGGWFSNIKKIAQLLNDTPHGATNA